MEKSDSIILKGQIGELLIFCCGLKHTEKSFRVTFEIFILNSTIFKNALFISHFAYLMQQLSLSTLELVDDFIFFLQLDLELWDFVLIPRITNSQEW